MANHHSRVVGSGLSDSSGPSNHHMSPYASLLHQQHQHPNGVAHHAGSSASFINQEGSAFDFGELEEAIVMQGAAHFRDDEAKACRPAATLEMFPAWPMRFQTQQRGSSRSGGDESTDSGSALNTTFSSKGGGGGADQAQFDPESPISKKPAASSSFDNRQPQQQQLQLHHQQAVVGEMMTGDHSNSTRTGVVATMPGPGGLQNQQPSSSSAKPISEKKKGAGSTSERILDAKTLRRLAQNREAARKSRLRKKAYVQQLESSRIKLSQLEQDLQRTRSQQGYFMGAGGAGASISSGAAIFDMEYARWLDDDLRHMADLRTAVQAHLSDGDLRVIVDSHLSHYDEIFQLKAVAAKTDVFHLITGMWATPAERCFLWMGGFRPSELIKIVMPQVDPLTEQQVLAIYSLQHSSQQAEEALSQGLDQLQQSLVDTIAGGPVIIDGMHQMATALGKLSNLEGFVRQADNLRQQTLHQLRRILTVRQAARCFLAVGEYYGRLRALSSLWASRPRETMMSDDNSCQTTTDLQMVQHSQNHHFSNF
uniref:Uncharacterized protein n=1 Tax=Kalanchoe fedtschenkoi TaxID=63787 RepID=A0A7N0U7H3_KALFE